MTACAPNTAVDRDVVAPAVLGEDLVDGLHEEQSPIVLVPCQRVPQPGEPEVVIALYQGEDGLALPVYSSIEALIESCGDQQPWMGMPVDRLPELQRLCAAEVVLWDVAVPAEFRHDSTQENEPR
jgi:hypothetical protein